MSIGKAEAKVEAAQDIGNHLDDMLEGAKMEHARDDGAKQALAIAIQKLAEHQKVADKELDDERIDKEQHNHVKRHIDHCGGILRNLLVNAEINAYQSQGKIQAIQSTLGYVKSYHDNEVKRVTMMANAIKHGVAVPDAPGASAATTVPFQERRIEDKLKDRRVPEGEEPKQE